METRAERKLFVQDALETNDLAKMSDQYKLMTPGLKCKVEILSLPVFFSENLQDELQKSLQIHDNLGKIMKDKGEVVTVKQLAMTTLQHILNWNLLDILKYEPKSVHNALWILIADLYLNNSNNIEIFEEEKVLLIDVNLIDAATIQPQSNTVH